MLKSNKNKALLVALFAFTAISLTACKEDTSKIDPAVLAQLSQPCAGKIQSVVKETHSGWNVTVSCNNKTKTKARREKMGTYKVDPNQAEKLGIK